MKYTQSSVNYLLQLEFHLGDGIIFTLKLFFTKRNEKETRHQHDIYL